MNQKYEVAKEDGVTVDGVDFVKGEMLELDADKVYVSELLADGSIIVVEPAKVATASAPHGAVVELSFDGKKVVGEVTDLEEEGKAYKCFTTEDGATFKIPKEEFEQKVS